MSYTDPIDTDLVQAVVDDLEDCNAHTLCDLLRAFYGLPSGVPQGEAEKAYRAAQWVIESWRMERWRDKLNAKNEAVSG